MTSVFASSLVDFRKTLAFLDTTTKQLASESTVLTPYKVLSLLDSGTIGSGIVPDSVDVRAIVAEEICEMALPAILDKGANYLSHAKLRHAALGSSHDAQTIRDKFRVLLDSAYVSYLQHDLPKGYGFVSYPAHMFHQPRDLVNRFPGLQQRSWQYAYPIVYELSGLRGRRSNSTTLGWIVYSYLRPVTMKEDLQLSRDKILEAVRVIEKLNGSLAALGGLTASLTDGGKYLVDKTSCSVTTGHSFTIANIINMMVKAVDRVGLPLEKARVAVVGASGSVGSGIAQMCAPRVAELILIDKRELNPVAQKNQASLRRPHFY